MYLHIYYKNTNFDFYGIKFANLFCELWWKLQIEHEKLTRFRWPILFTLSTAMSTILIRECHKSEERFLYSCTFLSKSTYFIPLYLQLYLNYIIMLMLTSLHRFHHISTFPSYLILLLLFLCMFCNIQLELFVLTWIVGKNTYC